MTVDELIKELQTISEKGKGNYVVIHSFNEIYKVEVINQCVVLMPYNSKYDSIPNEKQTL